MLIIQGNVLREGVEKKEAQIEQLSDWVLRYVESHTAGSPTDPKVKWTALRPKDIALYIKQSYQVDLKIAWIKEIYELKLIKLSSVNNTKIK